MDISMVNIKKKKSKVKKVNKLTIFLNSYAIFFLIFLFGSLYTFIGITKYFHYQTGLDIAIYIQSMWFYTHFQLPHVTLYPTFGDLVWADHFGPSLMLLTPFYLLWKDPRMLLIIQSFAFVSGAYPIYRYAKEKLQNNFLALSLAFVFLTYFGMQYPLTFDFHLGTMAASFMAWIFWAMFKGKWKTFVILCIIASGFKEDMPLYVSTISLYLILSRRNWKLGLIMFPLFLGYAYFVTEKLMPSFYHNAAKSFSLSYFSLRPDYLESIFFNSPVKLTTMFLSFSNTLFLSFFSGFFLLLPFAHFFINFSNPDFPGRWGIYLHYRGYSAAMMIFASILGYSFLMAKKPKIFNTTKAKKLLAILLIFNALLFDVLLHLPLNELGKKQFYYKESWIHDDNEVVKKVPLDAYLLTVNNLAPQVAYRKNIFYYPQNLQKAEYILVDLHPNQSIVNFWLSAPDVTTFKVCIDTIIHDKSFKVVYQKYDAMLLKRAKKSILQIRCQVDKEGA
jgi:uncharacterized membrane protein